ncbi:MAG TPA: PKD domain-containing protein, partial [Candidatus Syntrophosphaera sp.]|nr:PKD domain-containing protein [Candidatus Syntrophosphaera sp.]
GGYDGGYDIATDSQGNQYVAGYFEGTATFGPYTLTSSGNKDVFAAKLDPDGNWLWAVRAGGVDFDFGRGIAADGAGHALLTGYFEGTATFGPYTLTSSGNFDIFIAKLDEGGNWLWAVQAGGSLPDYGYGIAADGAGHACLTGEFQGSAAFGPSTLTSSGSTDIFAAQLDSNGNWLWAVRAGGTGADTGYGIAVDTAGNACLTGQFRGSAAFGPSTLTSSGSTDIFAVKLDTDGNWIWAVRAGGTGSDTGNGIAVDTAGNACLTGQFEGGAAFGPYTLTSGGSSDIFAAKLGANGSWLWAVRAGGTGEDIGNGIAVDTLGNACLTGYFEFGAAFGTYTLSSGGGYDIFAAKLDTNGSWLWAVRAGSPTFDYGESIALDALGNAFLTGYFAESAAFGPYTLTASAYDAFVARLGTLQADFDCDLTYGPEPLAVQFADQSTPGGYPITNWFWTFGDGGSSILQNPSYTYLVPGIYSVSLTVMDQNYQTSTMVRSNYITVVERVYAIELLTPQSYDFGVVYLEEQSVWQPVTLANTGNVALTVISATFYSQPSQFELQWYIREQIIPPGESKTCWVRFVPQLVGAVVDTLSVANDSANHPLIKIRLSGIGGYVPPKPPQNVQIAMDGYDAVLTWDAVTQNLHNQPITPDYYLVFYNGSADPENGLYYYHGASNTLSYTHYLVGLHADYMFYRVVAYKYYGRGAFDISALGLAPGMPEGEVLRLLP